MEKPVEIDIDGYSYLDLEKFKKELQDWREQISEDEKHIVGEDITGEDMYWEMVDWLDDKVTEDKDEDSFKYPIHVKLRTDGVVEIL